MMRQWLGPDPGHRGLIRQKENRERQPKKSGPKGWAHAERWVQGVDLG